MRSLKPLLDFDGTPLLGLLLEECRKSLVDAIVVVLGHERERILKSIDFSGVTVAVNADYRKGQTSSFQCALRAMDPATEAFVNLPVDHPLVTRTEIDAVVKAYRNRNGKSKIFIPRFGSQEGRPALFDASLRDEILALSPEAPVKDLIEKFRRHICHVSIDNPFTMRDMDTPEEYRQCLELFHTARKERKA
ncbi:MAG: nucleotidyltransferase family protein [Acidobacteria bacterium]|nr:nucleotidyltransferase family protein [Acidobacteriota bacterium]